MDYVLFFRVNYQKTAILITIKNQVLVWKIIFDISAKDVKQCQEIIVSNVYFDRF